MATKHGQTSFYHDDYKVQREFERLSAGLSTGQKVVTTSPNQTGGSGSPTTQQPTSNRPEKVLVVEHNGIKKVDRVESINFIDTSTMFDVYPSGYNGNTSKANIKIKSSCKAGVVYLNQLPLDPADMPPNTPNSELYKYENFTYTPSNGHYGWAVYGLIQHNFGLIDYNKYILNLVDLHSIDTNNFLYDLDYDGIISNNDYDIFKALHFENQQGIWEHEGLDANTVIVRGVYKPDLASYYGGNVPLPSLYYTDFDNRIIRTNLIYTYTILKGE